MGNKEIIIRLISLILAIFMVFSVVGCKPKEDDDTANQSSEVASNDDTSEDYDESDEDLDDDLEDEDLEDFDDWEDWNDEDDSWDEESWDDESWDDDGSWDDEDLDEDWDDEEDWDEDEEDEYVYYDEITIDNSKPMYEDYMGLNAIHECFTYIPDSQGRNYTEEMAQMEFDRVGQMELSVVRSYYGSKYAWDSTTGTFDWESAAMQGVYKWCIELQKRNIDVAFNACWSIEAVVDGSGWDTAPGVYVEGDFAKTCVNYGNFITESVKKMKAHGVNNVKYLLPFTEPGYAYEGENGNPNWAHVTTDKNIWEIEAPVFKYWLELVKSLDAALKTAGIRNQYQIVGPNESSWTECANGTHYRPMFYQAVTQANDYVDIFSHHYYIQTDDIAKDMVNEFVDYYYAERAQFVRETTGKHYWVDEYNMRDLSVNSQIVGSREMIDNDSHAIQIAISVAAGMRAGIQNMMLWTIADQQWPDESTISNEFYNGVQMNGLLPSLFETAIPRKSYYAVSLLTKYLGHNATTYEIQSDFSTAGCQIDENGEYTVMIVNNQSAESTRATVKFEENIGATTFYRHLYSVSDIVQTQEAKLIGVDKIIKMNGSVFYDEIPSNSFAVYTTRED